MMYPHVGLRKSEFFEEISLMCNYADEKLVEEVYWAMIKLICRQLRTIKRIKLPDWGEFYLMWYPPRAGINVQTLMPQNKKLIKCVKFKPDYKVKAYFKNFK
jgi:nucleoid DNA-binding protein